MAFPARAIAPSTCQRALVRQSGLASRSPCSSKRPLTRNTASVMSDSSAASGLEYVVMANPSVFVPVVSRQRTVKLTTIFHYWKQVVNVVRSDSYEMFLDVQVISNFLKVAHTSLFQSVIKIEILTRRLPMARSGTALRCGPVATRPAVSTSTSAGEHGRVFPYRHDAGRST